MMEQKRATIADVARRAGVAISTVSLTLNHPQRVAEATRDAVLTAVDQLGYRAGSQRRTRTIAVAAPFSTSPSYYQRLDGILAVLEPARIDVVVHDLPAANTSPAPILDVLPVRDDIDGSIVMGRALAADVEFAMERAALPVVVVDAQATLPAVRVSDEHGGRLIGEHLRDRGHSRVAFVHEPQLVEVTTPAGRLRWRGLREIFPDAIDVELTDDLDGISGVTALVCNHDGIALRVHELLRAARRDPRQYAITGFDDGPVARALDLTTVRQPLVESGRAAARLLIDLMAGESLRVSEVTLAVRLIVRGSTLGDEPEPVAQRNIR